MNKLQLDERAIANEGGARALGDQHPREPVAGQKPEVRVAWALIDSQPLIREALVRMIEEAGSPFIVGAASPHDLVDQINDWNLRIELIMLHLPNGPLHQERFCDDVLLLSRQITGVHVVVLSDRTDLDDVSHAIRRGVRGYISTSWSLPAVIHALKHVEAGNVHVPADALSHMLALSHDDATCANGSGRRRNQWFTPRQLEVLKLLRQGRPNKIIAYELKMQESTVKVHVRDIMKKMNVTNRTEAALRADQLLAELSDHNEPVIAGAI